MYEIALITINNEEQAETIARELVQNQLAACVNIIPGIKSVYVWNGKIEKDSELLLIAKTKSEAKERVMKKIQEIHPYENPECIFIGINDGLKNYLNWLDENIKD